MLGCVFTKATMKRTSNSASGIAVPASVAEMRCEDENAPARRPYEKNGFERVPALDFSRGEREFLVFARPL
jgi:hypothetical protein